MIFVIANIETATGRRKDVLEHLIAAVPLVREEPGCLDYSPAVDVDSDIDGQSDVRENVITIVERWESIEAFERHLMAPHTLEFREAVKGLLRDVALQIVEPV